MLTDGLECCGLLWCFYQTLILTAPIHCRASIAETLMQRHISTNLMKTQTHPDLVTFSANCYSYLQSTVPKTEALCHMLQFTALNRVSLVENHFLVCICVRVLRRCCTHLWTLWSWCQVLFLPNKLARINQVKTVRKINDFIASADAFVLSWHS